MTAQFTLTPVVTTAVCTPTLVDQIEIDLFGGGKFSLPMLPKFEDPLTLLSRALSGLGMQMSPLAPVLVVLKTVNAIVQFIVNLPANTAQAIAFNPQPLIDSVTNVVNSAVNLVALNVFPIQFARMARGFLTALRAYLVALQTQVNLLITAYTNVNALLAKAAAIGNAALLANATCAKERLDAKVAAINANIAAIGVPIALFIIVICIITGGEADFGIPTLDPNSLTAAAFDPPIAVIDALLAVIPNIGGLAMEC